MPSGPRILLDQGLPRDAADELRLNGIDCTHIGEIGMSASADSDILAYALLQDATIVTLDADFHAILAVSGASKPSIIRVRLQGLNGKGLSRIVREVLARYATEVTGGCMITVKLRKKNCHLLTKRG
jgi:predicted nuclease of predicted toxin-antitoxin system